MQALNFSMHGVLGTRNKSKTHDSERNLSPMILKGNQMVYSCIVYDYNEQVRLVTKIREDKTIYFLMSCTQGLVTQSAKPDAHDVGV